GFRFAPASDAAPLITGTLPLIPAIGAALVLGERFGMSRRIGLTLIGLGAVAVLVDGIYTGGAGGELSYAPRQQADLDQIAAYVRSAVGFDQKRGDQVQVVNL
ncbi:hypothetical protein J8J27_25285, partial [Mycobacterium tuberculosis]|nr:hypothetical protein [Mycobacterium tuberculosis]